MERIAAVISAVSELENVVTEAGFEPRSMTDPRLLNACRRAAERFGLGIPDDLQVAIKIRNRIHDRRLPPATNQMSYAPSPEEADFVFRVVQPFAEQLFAALYGVPMPANDPDLENTTHGNTVLPPPAPAAKDAAEGHNEHSEAVKKWLGVFEGILPAVVRVRANPEWPAVRDHVRETVMTYRESAHMPALHAKAKADVMALRRALQEGTAASSVALCLAGDQLLVALYGNVDHQPQHGPAHAEAFRVFIGAGSNG